MNVCDVSYADFVVWTVKECIVVCVDYDQSFCRQMCEKLIKHIFIFVFIISKHLCCIADVGWLWHFR